ncbi:MAG: dockerin type I domain-containing protein [Fimbriimonadales bacterium]|nr:dockerin type I domain-containing protein [Fimbriimonadales bacterium]
MWRTSDWQHIRTLYGHTNYVPGLAFTPDGNHLVSGGGDGAIRLWSLASGQTLRPLTAHRFGLSSVDFAPDGRRLISAGGDAHEWQVWNLQILRSWAVDFRHIQQALYSPDGLHIAMSVQGEVHLRRVADGAIVHTLPYEVMHMAFSPDGRYLATGGFNRIRLWRVSDGQLLYEIDVFSPISAITFSPDGQFFATGDWSGYIDLWRAATGEQVRTFSRHTDLVNSIAFTPNGQYLASGGLDRRVRLWRVADGALLQTLNPNAERVYAVAFTPDGRHLATGSSGFGYAHFPIRFWRVSDGVLTLVWETETYMGVRSIEFAPAGHLFLYMREDGVFVLARNPFAPPRVGDVDGDGCVDDADLLIVLFEFGRTETHTLADVNRDGVVNDADLLAVLFHLGQGCSR